MTTSDKEWQRVVILTDFPFFLIKEEPTTMHPKESETPYEKLSRLGNLSRRNILIKRNH